MTRNYSTTVAKFYCLNDHRLKKNSILIFKILFQFFLKARGSLNLNKIVEADGFTTSLVRPAIKRLGLWWVSNFGISGEFGNKRLYKLVESQVYRIVLRYWNRTVRQRKEKVSGKHLLIGHVIISDWNIHHRHCWLLTDWPEFVDIFSFLEKKKTKTKFVLCSLQAMATRFAKAEIRVYQNWFIVCVCTAWGNNGLKKKKRSRKTCFSIDYIVFAHFLAIQVNAIIVCMAKNGQLFGTWNTVDNNSKWNC